MDIAQRELSYDEIVARLSQPVPDAVPTVHHVPGSAASRVLEVARSLTSTSTCA